MNTIKWDCSKSDVKLDRLGKVLENSGRGRLIVLAHNNPDPDAIGSALAFQYLLKKRFETPSQLAYGGAITRAENQAMIHRLRINIKRFTKIDPKRHKRIALIDAQPGTGNNLISARSQVPLIILDHHPLRKSSLASDFADVRPDYGSTSTIVTEYLIAAGLAPSRSVANALLYGIKTDTNSLTRSTCQADFKALQYLTPYSNPRVLGWIEKPALPVEHFRDYHRGLSRTTLYRDVAVCYLGQIESAAIIPRLSDDLLRIDGVSWSLCMGEIKNTLMLSLRSTSRSFRAGNVVRRLIGRNGSSGGHRDFAGGQIPLDHMDPEKRQKLPEVLIDKFLGLIKRTGALPRQLVSPNPDECRL